MRRARNQCRPPRDRRRSPAEACAPSPPGPAGPAHPANHRRPAPARPGRVPRPPAPPGRVGYATRTTNRAISSAVRIFPSGVVVAAVWIVSRCGRGPSDVAGCRGTFHLPRAEGKMPPLPPGVRARGCGAPAIARTARSSVSRPTATPSRAASRGLALAARTPSRWGSSTLTLSKSHAPHPGFGRGSGSRRRATAKRLDHRAGDSTADLSSPVHA